MKCSLLFDLFFGGEVYKFTKAVDISWFGFLP